MKRPGGVTPPTLDLDGGGEERGAEYQPHTRLENQEEPTPPTPTQENEMEMQEGGYRGKEGAVRVRRKPEQRQIKKKRGDEMRFTRYPAGEL